MQACLKAEKKHSKQYFLPNWRKIAEKEKGLKKVLVCKKGEFITKEARKALKNILGKSVITKNNFLNQKIQIKKGVMDKKKNSS